MTTEQEIRLQVISLLLNAGAPYDNIVRTAIPVAKWIEGNICPEKPSCTDEKE